MDNILRILADFKNELNNPFPYKETDKIQEDFKKQFQKLSEDLTRTASAAP
ncbi:hypothetical protein [Bacillus solitudinis]|uniref:hypothetical protein n=1 Tax=Bacillus solitudinis TaxID=2014074 RepID=UPI0012FE1ADB|nr:hypothetical protein [Bacillus solitudinis]